MQLDDIHIAYSCIHNTVYTPKSPMALHIRDDRAAKLARRLADRSGISMTEAVISGARSGVGAR